MKPERSLRLSSGHASQAARASHAASAVNLTSPDAQARTASAQVKSALDDVRDTSDHFSNGAPLYKVGRMALGQHARQVLRRAGNTEVASMLWDPLVDALTNVPSEDAAAPVVAHLGQVAEFVEDRDFTPEAGFANMLGGQFFLASSVSGANMALAGLTHRMDTMEKKQDEILAILRSGPPGALSSSGAGARVSQALLTEWAKMVHFSMASDPVQLLRGANRPTKSMMHFYADAVPMEELFTKHVPPSLVSLGVTSMATLNGRPLPQGARKWNTCMYDKLQAQYNSSVTALKGFINEAHTDIEKRALLFHLKPYPGSEGQGYEYLSTSCAEFVHLGAKWLHISFNGDRLLVNTTGDDLNTAFVNAGGSVLTLAAVVYVGAVLSGHFGSSTALEIKSNPEHMEVYWVIAQKLVEAHDAGHIFIPGFAPGEAKDNLEEKIQQNLSKFQSAGRSELEAAFAPVLEDDPQDDGFVAENEGVVDEEDDEL